MILKLYSSRLAWEAACSECKLILHSLALWFCTAARSGIASSEKITNWLKEPSEGHAVTSSSYDSLPSSTPSALHPIAQSPRIIVGDLLLIISLVIMIALFILSCPYVLLTTYRTIPNCSRRGDVRTVDVDMLRSSKLSLA